MKRVKQEFFGNVVGFQILKSERLSVQRTKRSFQFSAVIIILISLLFPSFSEQKNAYQNGLWTSDNFFSTGRDGTAFSFGGTIDGIVPWKRMRMGFPLKATTIDYQPKHNIIQTRIEWGAIVLNVIFILTTYSIGVGFLFLFRKTTRWMRHKRRVKI